jgi:hypothetical protein
MTPNNIVNMAFIKGLDIISVTDHNACKHARVLKALSDAAGILFIPGMEVQTREEVHMLCYFPTVTAIEAFDDKLELYKSKILNNTKVFGNQLILDADDVIIGEIANALILSVEIGIEDLEALVLSFGGAIVPAHINKSSNSILVNLGFIPSEMKISCIEIHEKSPINEKLLGTYRRLYNSDAHYLENIQEPVHTIDLAEKTSYALIDYLTGKD